MTQHADTRVDKLSGGQRKRASVALELLTGPSLLILDEPTSGLDPALDRQVMTMLRQLADAGRVVLVVTHSLTYLDVCDQVLLLAPGGKTAFYGPPTRSARRWAPPTGPTSSARSRATPTGPTSGSSPSTGRLRRSRAAQKPADLGSPTRTSLRRQFSTISRRQMRLIVSDRGYFIFLMLLPFIMGVLSLSVPGDVGFGVPVPAIQGGAAPNEPGQILVMLNVGAIFMGTALTIRALIGERAIFLREQAVGLSTTAYLLAKVFVFTVFAIDPVGDRHLDRVFGQGVGRRGRRQGRGVLGNRTLELFVDIAVTCVAAAMVGLALSALARSQEQIMPLLVVAIMSQLVFSGGMIPVTDRLVLDQMSWFTPARWGFASSASTIDLTRLVPSPLSPNDSHWHHTAKAWLFDMAMLAAICVGYTEFVRWKIRLKARLVTQCDAVSRSLAVNVEPVRRGIGQRLLDVDLRAAHLGGGPQRRVGASAAQVGLVEPEILRPHAPQVGASQHRLAQIGTNQAGFGQPAVREIDATQITPAKHGQRQVDFHQRHGPQPAVREHRPEQAALPKGAVVQRRPLERAVAEGGADVLRFGEVHAAEVALVENRAFGTQPAQILVAEVMADEFPLGPNGFVGAHRLNRAPRSSY